MASTRRRGRVGRVLCALLTVVAGVAANAPAAPAGPTPAPTVASLTAKLDSLAAQTKTLTDRYNAGEAEVRAVEMRANLAVEANLAAQQAYRQQRGGLTGLVSAEYKHGQMSSVTALVGSPDHQRYLDTVETMRVLAQRRADRLAQVAAARDHAQTASDALNKLLDEASRRRDDLARQRKRILAQAELFTRIRGTLTLATEQAGAAPATATASAIMGWATKCVQQAEEALASGDCGGLRGYVNPIKPGQWVSERTDQGVDWGTHVQQPVVAIGDGIITYSKLAGTGWPGAFIAYGLTSGNHAGLFIFVAENITDLLPVGTRVKAGQQIATAIPGGSETEWGYAAAPGTSSEPATPYNGAPDGTPTAGGKAFARFLIELGAKPLQPPGPGPDRP